MFQVTGLKNNLSLTAVLLLSVAIVFFRFVYPPYSILTWDVFGYYLYLPAIFIHGDIALSDISWIHQVVDQYNTTSTLYQLTALPEGGWVLKYSSGIALLNMPAFFVAHAYSYLFGYKTDGFSTPYQFAWAISGLIYTVIGLWMMRRILLQYFTEQLSALLLLLLVLATNYFQLTAFDGYLSHNYLFTLYTFIIWYTIQWHRTPKLKTAIGLGFFIGLAILSRPNEMVALLIPLFWNVYNRKSLLAKWHLMVSKLSQPLGAAIAMAAVGSLQLIYWKLSTGNWVFYSYNNAGEGFDFLNPYILQVLFSFRKGWLVYTPIMMFAIAGIILLYKQNKTLFVPVALYFFTNLYIVSSWTCWWYAGGSYSQRALLSSYALLLIPLGYMLKYLVDKGKLVRSMLFTILFLITLLNVFQTWQWVHGIIDGTRMSKEYYFAVFGKTYATVQDRKLLLIERSVDGVETFNNEDEYSLKASTLIDFESEKFATLPIGTDTVYKGSASLRMNSKHCFSPAYEASYSNLTSSDHAWIRAGVWVYPTSEVKPAMASLVISFEHKGEVYGYRAYGIDKKEFDIKPFQWNYISADYLTPEVRSNSDKVKIYFWLQGNQEVLIDNLKIDVYEPKNR